ncbi:MAG TPA: hypothetical protein VFJ61_11450 [Solirubrobacterales bacterium]|nr:hypothetical protein [Solirubrobacterales bacterium]
MATVEEIKGSAQKTVVSGPAVVAAAKKPAVISFWEKARAYGASMRPLGAITLADL